MEQDKMSYGIICISIDKELLTKIDSIRAKANRSYFIGMVLKSYIDSNPIKEINIHDSFSNSLKS